LGGSSRDPADQLVLAEYLLVYDRLFYGVGGLVFDNESLKAGYFGGQEDGNLIEPGGSSELLSELGRH